MNYCIMCGEPAGRSKFCKSHRNYSRGRKCKTCNKPIYNDNITGYCVKHNKYGSNNPFFEKHHSVKTIEKIKKINRKISTELWKNPLYRETITKKVSKPRRNGFKSEQSARIKKWYKENPDQIDIRSKAMKDSWRCGKIVPVERISINTSKIEKRFFTDIQNIYGDKVIKKSLKNPDGTWMLPDSIFIDIYHIIEFFGDYWHANPEIYSAEDLVCHNTMTAKQVWEKDEKRIKKLENLGYMVEIIWEQDYKKDRDSILERLNNYLNWDSCHF